MINEVREAAGGQWRLCRVRSDSPPADTKSLLGQWHDLAERERGLALEAGQLFLLPPDGWPDRDVLAYFNSGSFRRLAVQTQESYATALKVHLTFLASQGLDWRNATEDTFLDFDHWRRRDWRNLRRISGATFARELAACRRFYDWQARRGVIKRSPVVVDEVRRRDGSVRTVARLHPSNARRSRVKWLTPRAYRRWRDVGLGGYGADGLRDTSWRGRNNVRNPAFADLLWSSGLRLREAATLLLWEVPAPAGGRFVRGRVGEAVAKGASRDFWVAERALRGIGGYLDSARAAAVGRAQQQGRYADLDGVLVAKAAPTNRQVVLVDDSGESGRISLDALSAEDRCRVFVEGPTGMEPAMLWLTESGMPMPYNTWQRVFAVANARCRSQAVPIGCHPHMLRHSFALQMLLTLIHAFERRFDLTPRQREEHRTLFGDPYVCVQVMLGHSSSETTKNIYLEPAKGLEVDLFLNDDDEDHEHACTLLARVVQASDRVLDDPQ